MKKRKSGHRTRKGKVEKELEKLADALRLILACAEWRRDSKSDFAYELYKGKLRRLNLPPEIYEQSIQSISRIIGV